MKVTDELVNSMYRFSGISKDKLIKILKSLDPKKCLDPSYHKKWTPENPFYGYSYFIAEFLYFYVAPKGSICKRIFYKKQTMLQYIWFVQWPDKTLIDLTLPQFIEVPEYAKALIAKFITNKPQLTTRKIAEGLGYSEEDLG